SIVSNPPVTITVDDDGPADYPTIQEGVDAASPGDIVFVKNGIYYENVVIDKSLNLSGESRDNTIINATSIGIFVDHVDYVNISGFFIENGSSSGISLLNSTGSKIDNNRIEKNTYGIKILNSNNAIIINNIVDNSDPDGIYLFKSSNNTINNNICLNSFSTGIRIYDNSKFNVITENNCSFNNYGIKLSTESNNNRVNNNRVFYNDISAFDATGIGIYSSYNNTLNNNTISNNKYGVAISATLPGSNVVINSTIKNSIEQDVLMGSDSKVTLLNTTFNKDSVYHVTTTSQIEVSWFLHINVIDYLSNPIPNVNVKIEDNKIGTYNETITTDGNGFVKWFIITEYIDKDVDGDTIGDKTYFTPYRIVAWNDTLVGYVYPEPYIENSMSFNIILYNGTLIDIENMNWNLISIPRIQVETNLVNVLQSIEGRYNAVQWYDVTDINDHWKHYHVLKPSSMNDLKEINHTMGFWLDITDPQGTTLVVFGDELDVNQTITLFPGWNLVGYPSKLNRQRNISLNNIDFGNDVDKIERYNSTTGRIEEVLQTDYLEIGQSYWIHSKKEIIWDVPR
ncbi:MAG: right-handed parallel beta-helix repeat-containing protein, partial [Candidatus Kariarchaeaceae archaeon]